MIEPKYINDVYFPTLRRRNSGAQLSSSDLRGQELRAVVADSYGYTISLDRARACQLKTTIIIRFHLAWELLLLTVQQVREVAHNCNITTMDNYGASAPNLHSTQYAASAATSCLLSDGSADYSAIPSGNAPRPPCASFSGIRFLF